MGTTFRKGFLFCLFLFICLFHVFPSAKAEAAGPRTQQLPGRVLDWVMDDQNGYIYALTEKGMLLFIEASTLSIKKQEPVSLRAYSALWRKYTQRSVTLLLRDGKLYVPSETSIDVFDVKTKRLIQRAPYNGLPFGLLGNKIVTFGKQYGRGKTTYEMYMWDLAAKRQTSRLIADPNFFSVFSEENTLFFDEKRGLAFIGRNVSIPDLAVLRLSDLKVVKRVSYQGSRGSAPIHPLIVDGSDVFFAGRRIDAGNINMVHDCYNGPVLDVQGAYVVTNKAVYDRYTSAKINALPFPTNYALMDAKYNLYLIKEGENRIYKYPLPADESYYVRSSHYAFTNVPISHLAYDSSTGWLYVLSAEDSKLFVIRASDMKMVKEIHPGPQPTDVKIDGGKVYVALSGATKMAIYDAKTMRFLGTVPLIAAPRSLAIGDGKIFFTDNSRTLTGSIAVYDMKTKKQWRIPKVFINPLIGYDEKQNVLYVGQEGTSDHNLYAVRLSDWHVSQLLSFPGGDDAFFMNGGEIFYGKARINPAQPGALVAAEFPEPLRAASRQYIITSRAIYNRATGTKIADLSSEALLATAGDDGMIFTYRKVATNHYLIKQKLSQ
ncbi:hypothetical protein Gste01_00258 [Geobacillus stearothermophilus ATCC 7953]